MEIEMILTEDECFAALDDDITAIEETRACEEEWTVIVAMCRAIEAAVIAKLAQGVDIPKPAIETTAFSRDSSTQHYYTADQLRTCTAAAGVKAYAAAGASPVQPVPTIKPDTSVLQAAQWPPAGDTQPSQLIEPEAMRYDFDGFGWRYIDNGSGSDWMTRHPDGEFLFTKLPAAVPPSQALSLDLLERLSKTLTRLGYATPEGGMEHFNADLVNQLYSLCRAVDSLFDREQPPAPSDTAITYMTGYSDGREWAKPSQALVVEPVYQYQLANGNWIDQTKESYDYNVKHGQATVRMLYAAPQAAPLYAKEQQ